MRVKTFLAGAALIASVAGAADAAVTISITQSGSDVVATVVGSIDTSTLSFQNATNVGDYIQSGGGFLTLGTGSANVYTLSGPSAFGAPNSSFASATSTLGMVFGMNQGRYLYLDSSYVSNSAFTSTDTFAGKTFASLGLTDGTTFNYTAGANQITLTVGTPASVPEPASWAMMVAGFGAIGFAMRRKAKAGVATRLPL